MLLFLPILFICWGLNPNLKVSVPVFGCLGGTSLELEVLLDNVSMLFVSLLLTVVYCISLFSEEYLSGELFKNRFLFILYSFVLSMVVLITSSKVVLFLLGWDGLGLTSFLLMCFYQTSVSWSSSLKTFLINRLGDGLLLIGVFSLFLGSSSKYSTLSPLESVTVSVLLLSGLLTKSAIYPFSSWLPAAMAAPTPVSALVHSSTLVTAGLYLVVRLYPLLPMALLDLLGALSLWTILMASVSALCELDVKKVMAFSTLSQLGLMAYTLSVGAFTLSLYHLFCHAMFKANMFICGGYILLTSNHHQDMRLTSSQRLSLSESVSLTLSTLNLSGGVFLTGFYSKDAILDSFQEVGKVFAGGMFMLTLPLTVLYGFRLLYMFGSFSGGKGFGGVSCSSVVPLYLSLISLVFGWGSQNLFLGEHFPPFMGKVLLFLLMPVVLVLLMPEVPTMNSNLSNNIGGLQFLNSDGLLFEKVSLGDSASLTLDKGLLAYPYLVFEHTGNLFSSRLAGVGEISLLLLMLSGGLLFL